MNKTIACLAALLLATLAGGGAVADERAAIRFADYGGIENWRPGPDGSLLVEARNGEWYRATFTSPCRDLKFSQSIGFVTDGLGRLDKFSSVVVSDGQRCYFKTFERIEDPDRKE